MAFTVKATGCEDFPKPRGMWIKRTTEETSVGCENSEKIWNLHCKGIHWTGVIGNCTEGRNILRFCPANVESFLFFYKVT